MKLIARLITITFFISLIFSSCKKDRVTNNKPPFANAGADQIITLPINAVIIDGTGSFDHDGKIELYSWKQIIGPNQSIISNSLQVSSEVNNLIQGIYLYELKVTDNRGLSSKDTVQISVNPLPVVVNECSMQLSPIGNLSIARWNVLIAAAGNKILFAGGNISQTDQTTRVDIYDKVLKTWSIAELSQTRMGMGVAVAGTKIFFAGGYSNITSESSKVDIYDAVANIWSTAELSVGRLGISGAATGNKVFFAGGSNGYGDDYDIVDIYDISRNIWSTTRLSETTIDAITLNNKIYFFGGSKNVTIYDGTSNSWSVFALPFYRYNMARIAFGDTIYFAGGTTYDNGIEAFSDKVEMYDVNTGNTSFHQLSEARSNIQAVRKNDKILFYAGSTKSGWSNKVDFYNISTNEWSACQIPPSLRWSAIFSSGDKVYITSANTNQVFELEF